MRALANRRRPPRPHSRSCPRKHSTGTLRQAGEKRSRCVPALFPRTPGRLLIFSQLSRARALLADDAGLFYDHGDLDGAAEAVARLAMFPERRRTIGRRARARSEDYDWSRASGMVWRAYEELLGDTRGAGAW